MLIVVFILHVSSSSRVLLSSPPLEPRVSVCGNLLADGFLLYSGNTISMPEKQNKIYLHDYNTTG